MSGTNNPFPSARKVIAMDKGYGGEVIFEDTRETVAWCGDNGHGIKGFELAKLIADLWNQNVAKDGWRIGRPG